MIYYISVGMGCEKLRGGKYMHHINLILAVCAAIVFLGQEVAYAQENCASPLVIPSGASGDTLLDLCSFADDYCDYSTGPDVVFLLDGYDVPYEFSITNESGIYIEIFIFAHYGCDPEKSCYPYLWQHPLYPGYTLSFYGVISEPVYFLVDGPGLVPLSLPLRFAYSVATPAKKSTWSSIKMLYAD